jgi:hypothetical protein
MSAGDYLIGLLFFAVTVGACLGAAAIVVRRRLSHLVGAPLVLAYGLVATVVLIGVHLVPGALGVLTREAVAVVALATLGGVWFLVRATAVTPLSPAPEPMVGDGTVSKVLAGVALAIVGAAALVFLRANATVAVAQVDALNFHLPDVARWIQTETFWRVDEFNPGWAFGNYPQNGNVVMLSAVLPWSNDALVRFVNVPFFLLTGVGIYGVACELRAPRAAAALFGAVALAMPVVLWPALRDGLADPVMLATFATGALFLLRHWRTSATSDLVLAGLGLGVAFGTKWYGISTVVAVLAVWTVGSLIARRPWKKVAVQLAALSALVAATGGFWLIRNLVESANPLFPVKVAIGGFTLFDAPFDTVRARGGFTIAHYATHFDVIRDFIVPAWERTYGLAGALLAAGVLGAVIAALVQRKRQSVDGRVIAIAVAFVVLFVVYVITPFSALGPENRPLQVDANARYFLPALLLAGALCAWLAGRLGRARIVLEIVAVAAAVDGVRRAFDISKAQWLVVAVLLFAGLVALLRVWPRVRGWRPGSRRAAFALAAVVLLLLPVVAVAGRLQQDRFNAHRYRGTDPVLDWLQRSGGHRVGLSGSWSNAGLSPVLPAFGPRFGNHVQYVGPSQQTMLKRYTHAAPFVAALHAGHYDVLVIGRGEAPGEKVPELAWARSAGYVPFLGSDRLVALRAK